MSARSFIFLLFLVFLGLWLARSLLLFSQTFEFDPF